MTAISDSACPFALPVLVLALSTCLFCGCSIPSQPAPRIPATPCAALNDALSAEDQAFLDDLQKRIVDYFWTEIYPETGIAIDHTENRTGKVAATGFGLAAICIGIERGWIPYDDGYARVLHTMHSFWDDPDDPNDLCVDGHFGLFWHFVDGRTGRMKPVDCVAICDSADLIAGVLVAGEYFKGTEVEALAQKIYDRVEWNQFATKRTDGRPGLMSFGWVPLHVSENYYETDGLLNFNMSGFADNSLLIYVLALGSDTHPIPQETWEEYVDTFTLDEYAGYECVFAGQLFCRQVPHAFVRFSRKRDRVTDYFLDTVNALLADRAFNIAENKYPPQVWGLTDCFGKDSYSHAGPPGPVMNDGTVGTTAFAGALPHIPSLSMEAMRYVRERFGDRVYGRYGFTSSVNLKNDFVSPLYVGIELGPMVMLIENYRSGLIWDLFSRSRVMRNFVRRAGMSGVVDDFELPPEAPAYALWSADGATVTRSDVAPQHGRACLALSFNGAEATVTAQLTENDLLDFHFSKVLSVWTRDMEVVSCAATLDGQVCELRPAGRIRGGEWQHLFFELPASSQTSKLCGLTFSARRAGNRPALDNITMEEKPGLGAPAAITDLRGQPGDLPESAQLQWTVPDDPDGGRPARYVLSIREPGAEPRASDFPATRDIGEREDKVMLLGDGKTCSVTLAAVDRDGHRGPESAPVTVTSRAGALNRIAYDFEGDSMDGWASTTPDIRLRIEETGEERAIRMDYTKTHGWLFVTVALDPRMVELHRYLRMRMKGHGTLLTKLWCSETLQEDIRPVTVRSDTEWTTVLLDTRLATQINTGRDQVLQLLLFPAPGEWSGSGTLWIGELAYAE